MSEPVFVLWASFDAARGKQLEFQPTRRRSRGDREVPFSPLLSAREVGPRTELPDEEALSSLSKRAKFIFKNDRAVLLIEFRPIIKILIHNRAYVLNVFGAEDMPQLVDQRYHVHLRLHIGPAVVKRS